MIRGFCRRKPCRLLYLVFGWIGSGVFLCFLDVCVASAPIQSRQLQLIQVGNSYQIGVDTDPQWSWKIASGNSAPVFIAVSPEHYYPPTIVTFSYYTKTKLPGTNQALKGAALEAIVRSARNFGFDIKSQDVVLQPVKYRNFSGFSSAFTAEHQKTLQDVEVHVGRAVSGHPVSMTVITRPAKLPHLSHLISRIGNSFAPINDTN